MVRQPKAKTKMCKENLNLLEHGVAVFPFDENIKKSFDLNTFLHLCTFKTPTFKCAIYK